MAHQNLNEETDVTVAQERQSFPAYGVSVLATTTDGETGVWLHGDRGWYPEEKWGHNEFPHDHIVEWEAIPNAERTHGEDNA